MPDAVLLDTEVSLLHNVTHACWISQWWCLRHLGSQPEAVNLGGWRSKNLAALSWKLEHIVHRSLRPPATLNQGESSLVSLKAIGHLSALPYQPQSVLRPGATEAPSYFQHFHSFTSDVCQPVHRATD